MHRLLPILLLLLPSCTRADPPASRNASPTSERSPATSARVVVRFTKGGVTLTSGGPDVLRHVLVVVRDGKSSDVLLQEFTFGYIGHSPPAQRQPALDAAFDVAFAPDGHAILVTKHGEPRALYVALDAGERPFLCGFGDATTTTHAKVRASFLLGAADAPCDPGAARDYACAHRDDAELWERAAAWFVRDDVPSTVDSDRYPMIECLRDVIHTNAAARKTLTNALSTRATYSSTAAREHAAESLATADDAATQDALASQLSETVKRASPKYEECWLTAKLAWSLAAITTKRKAGSPLARTALLDVALTKEACGNDLAAKAARVYGVFALAKLDDHPPSLVELAKTCTSPPKPWSIPFHQWNDAQVNVSDLRSRPIACFARDAADPQ